jgi:hypothetical protein
MNTMTISPPTRLVFVLFVTCLSVFGPAQLWSQGGRCAEDPCENAWNYDSMWVAPGWHYGACTNYGTTTCNVKVYFSYRLGCDGGCELKIHRMTYTAGATGCQCSWQDIWTYSLLGLILSHPLTSCQPNPGDCITNVRVWTEGCWQPEPGNDALSPCASFTMCCKAVYKVCRTTAGDPTIELISSTGSSFSCPTNCHNVCNLFPLEVP